uniref:Uncharacterized protein n=1 Tax=Panagrolaimus superbus TaxID=310955 RepID=A0A914YHD8_9BILA
MKVFALYKGSSAPAVCVTPIFALYFGGCAVGRWLQRTEPDQELTFVQTWGAGALAGLFTTIIATPGERVKCLLQVQLADTSITAVKYSGPIDVITKLYKEGGIRSIYRGGAATILRGMLYFCLTTYSPPLKVRSSLPFIF